MKNREIKFRGKRRDNGEWIYGFPMYNSGGVIGKICGWKEPEDDSFGGYFEYDILPETLSEYTGLKDKNGKEVYEGDIVSDGKTIYTVEYNTQNTAFWIIAQKSISNESFALMVLDSNIFGNGYYKRDDIEIIGNIYETPELLNQ